MQIYFINIFLKLKFTHTRIAEAVGVLPIESSQTSRQDIEYQLWASEKFTSGPLLLKILDLPLTHQHPGGRVGNKSNIDSGLPQLPCRQPRAR